MLAIRVGAEDLAVIDQRAEAAGLTRTQYLIDAALGRLPASDAQHQLDELRERLERLEKRRRSPTK